VKRSKSIRKVKLKHLRILEEACSIHFLKLEEEEEEEEEEEDESR
jgi:hypothetical protein